jgi:hypothetical protein
MRSINRPAIMLQQNVLDNNGSEVRAILVSIGRDEQRTHYVTYIMDALVFPMDSNVRWYGNLTYTDSTHWWCVD